MPLRPVMPCDLSSLLVFCFITCLTWSQVKSVSRRNDGFVVCGGPVGSDSYIDAFVRWKTNEAITKVSAISLLGGTDFIPSPKHVAFKLLAATGVKMMSYVAMVVPPRYTVSHFKRFDSAVRDVFFNLLHPVVLPLTDR